MDAISIEPARREDLAAIAGIYHHYVLTSAHTFDLEVLPDSRWNDWFARFDGARHKLLIGRQDDSVLGYTFSDAYRPRAAYDPCVLTSVYVAPEHVGRGVGTSLYHSLFDALDGEDIHRAYAAISMPNPTSVRLHVRFGFTQVGYFSEQGRKFGRYWDVAWYERNC